MAAAMKFDPWKFVDLFVPAAMKQLEGSEELLRARIVVCGLLISVCNSTTTTLTSLLAPSTLPFLQLSAVPVYAGCLVGFSATLWVFKRWALFGLVGNLCIAQCYAGILFVALYLPPQEAHAALLVLFALPPLMELLSGMASALAWLGIIALTAPVMLKTGYIGVDGIYIVGWETACFGLLIAMSVGYFYRKGIVARLNAERARFKFAAGHDALTGIANRATFDEQLRECIDTCRAQGGRATLILIDLDNFKPINDTYGHPAGDSVLRVVADRLRQVQRNTDMVARLGGDEFALLLRHDRRLREAIEQPIALSGTQICIEYSYGVATCPEDGLHPGQLAAKADRLMYDAKRLRKASADASMQKATVRTLSF
jgi:diguanylate cyclase (GGDEF)-like protein